MAKKKLLTDFQNSTLTEQESKQVKGGRNYIPTNSGSYGFINWDDIDIRNDGIVGSTGSNRGLKTLFGDQGR